MTIEAPPLERKLVAILAADVEGYSRMMHLDEEATLNTLSAFRAVTDELIAAAAGTITSTAGDSILAEFASVVAAVNCAVAIQTDLAASNAALPAEQQMHFRIGINVGDVMVKDGGIFGDGVNVAARVEALAPPGGISVTRGVRDHVRDRVDYGFEDLGDHSVKNIARPIHVFRVVFDESEKRDDRFASISPSAPPESAEGSEAVELAFWNSVQSSTDPQEYQAYLDRYPDGTFVALASARLSSTPTAAGPPTHDSTIELVFWDSVKDSDDPEMFEAYLTKYPEGEFMLVAELRATALRKERAD